ncbi:BTAD domain-containing putative transcriptional regulator [Streptomyces sp. NPDC099050]|uniref:BTAD domain-containing putative transcriptional regulator n=1 Tax=Streptomyces sp. NPDC099050 TaxID=3366100 RepID=UPI00382ECEBD
MHATGRRAETRALFPRVRRTLIEEQGMEPGRGLTAVHGRIVEAAPEEAPQGDGPAAPAGTQAPPGPQPAAGQPPAPAAGQPAPIAE